jgi:DNA-binding SARP family transcriptional activator
MHIIRLLGGISIEGSQGLLTGRAVQRGRIALLSCLALSPTRSASRERLMALLWPDADGDRSRHLLRDAVYRLRETLGADAVRKTGDDLRLDAKCVRVDVWEFEEAVARNDLETSVRLYAGDLLDAYSLGDSVELEWWIDGERARLRELFARALEGVAEQRGRISRDLVGAVSAWKRLAAIDPHNSRVALRLMEALEVAGDRAGALRHAAKHTALLESDLGAAPDPNVSAFAVKLRVHPEPRSHIAVPPSKPADAPSADAGSSAFATGDAPSRGA